MDGSHLRKSRKPSKILLFFLFTLTSCLSFLNVSAADGCYVGGYLFDSPTAKSGNYFYNTPATGGCINVTLSGTCYIYDGSGNVQLGSNYVTQANSYSSSISIVACPIDDHIWFLMVMVGGFTFYRLKSISSFFRTLR